MQSQRSKKINKNKKRKITLLFLIAGLIVLWILVGIVVFFYSSTPSIYIYPENPKQGDTVFIRVKSDIPNVEGSFENENIDFYRKNNSNEWIALLGMDAGHQPGEYQIKIKILGLKEISKKIKLQMAEFSLEKEANAPSPAKTGISNETALLNMKNKDNPAINKVLENFTKEPYFNSPFSAPLTKMKKSGFDFGRFIGFPGKKVQHAGVDLLAPEKTEVHSINDGKVVATLELSNYGKTVIIDHGLDIFSLYLHLSQFNVSVGDMVKKKQVVGLSGNTGYSTAPHLHFSVRVDKNRVDPISFIKATEKINQNYFLADIYSGILNFLGK